ncbi:hypothetical protein D3878_10150 [Noviherbaspirillum sedimenti]|uniref:Uncharacterized protein n=1 Tax=Noviherbaspirillum sedimenti TaxID=2320865 RepID=A0A3A3G2L5_9BURK|nr:hypothetical protein D3878_10150 [Noviherbaspirillum sedimenti]
MRFKGDKSNIWMICVGEATKVVGNSPKGIATTRKSHVINVAVQNKMAPEAWIEMPEQFGGPYVMRLAGKKYHLDLWREPAPFAIGFTKKKEGRHRTPKKISSWCRGGDVGYFLQTAI